MPLTNVGRDHLAQAAIGEAVTAFNNASANIAVGNSATAFAATQTDLVGASKFRKQMDATFPTRAANVLTFRATFATGDANFAWAEWGITNSVASQSGGTLLNRKVDALGTKTSSQSWQFTVTLTVTNP
jgi:hypothetical protein